MGDSSVNGQDIPIAKLFPLTERCITKSAYDKIAASIRAVGLLDPLVVYPERSHYVILDGRLRFQILLDMGIEVVPCIIWKEKEAFTANRMVNRLSRAQEARMIRKSLDELDEATIGVLQFARTVHSLISGRAVDVQTPPG
jgi:ParB-like chromosome segregation protein Spo0J